MGDKIKKHPRPFFLGIEGGGTHTVAVLADAAGQLVARFEAGAGNIKLLTEKELTALFQSVAAKLPKPDAVVAGMAGARLEQDCRRVRETAEKAWPKVVCRVTNDLETALAADDGRIAQDKVLVLSGTGSCCYGRSRNGKTARAGGWGHILGDPGSAYQISLAALKQLVVSYDHGVWPKWGARILRRLQMNEPDELVEWIQHAPKAEVADLAMEVFAAWEQGDRTVRAIVKAAAENLASDAVSCARRLDSGARVKFVFAGGVLLQQPRFARLVAAAIQKHWPRATIEKLKQEGAWGAVTLAREGWQNHAGFKNNGAGDFAVASKIQPPDFLAVAGQSPTERRNPRSTRLDKLSTESAIRLMLSEDAKIPAAILRERKPIARAVNLIARSMAKGGRLIYVGAGTSGRLGVLDASECPPTFRTDPEMVQGIIAGGRTALWRSVEGAEDDFAAGARGGELRHAGRGDVVVGIAAGGRTPFVWGVLTASTKAGAATVLVTCNPKMKLLRKGAPDVIIAPDTGPEVLTGSTRLKAGTATKLILNILTTLAMTRLGRVVENLMVDLNPSNTKLRERAVGIVQELRGVDAVVARAALEQSGWDVKKACARLQKRVSAR